MVADKRHTNAGGTSKSYLEYRSEMYLAMEEMLVRCEELDLSYRKEMTKIVQAWIVSHQHARPDKR